jgi:hypothetical protein
MTSNAAVIQYDPEAGRRAYEQMRDRIASTSEGAPVNGRLQLACVAVLSVANDVEQPAERQKFQALSGFDMTHLTQLRPLAWALWHTLTELCDARAGSTSRRVDADVVEEGDERKDRMLQVVKYYLADDPVVDRVWQTFAAGRATSTPPAI